MVFFPAISIYPSKETSMLSTIHRSVFTVLLPAGLAILLCTQTVHAQQRRGTLQRQQNAGFSQAGRCQGGQLGSQSQLSTSYLQPQLYNQAYLQPQSHNLGQLYTNQALLSGLQQQYALNALQQYVMEAQLTGTDPNEALQSALLAMQLNQLNAARLRALQNR
jgi:hypothetical protein